MEGVTKENLHERIKELQKRYDELGGERKRLSGLLDDVWEDYQRVGRELNRLKTFDYHGLFQQYVRINGKGVAYMFVCNINLCYDRQGDRYLMLYGPRVRFQDYETIGNSGRYGVSFHVLTDNPQYYLDGINGFSAKPEQVEIITREEFLEACQTEFGHAVECVDRSIESYRALENDKNNEKHED